ncbi:MAG: hydrogenase formation protein HypD, partial [Acidobacteriaceae bacterium]
GGTRHPGSAGPDRWAGSRRMTSLDNYRRSEQVHGLVEEIRRTVRHPWVIMEICGGQTHAIMKYGLDQLLPENIELVHGPGCPVCVTSLEMVDKAHLIASQPEVIFTTYGDMLRVPGSHGDLFSLKALGKDIRIVYSSLDAVKLAEENPGKQVVFFAIGFETTAPANAMSVLQAQRLGLTNFSLLVSQVRVPPAIRAILGSPGNRVQGFLAAGHVCAVMGYWEYEPLSVEFHVPIVVTGFEPADILLGISKLMLLLERQALEVQNAYPRVVTREGNRPAQAIIDQVFMEFDQKWRGIGTIPASGWKLRPQFRDFDAEVRYSITDMKTSESPICIAGKILQGLAKPYDCPAFGRQCSPENPLGATMVSSEGACAAYYRYGRST